MKDEFVALGLMSGTSLDGLDMALVRFRRDTTWSFKILKAQTVHYPAEQRLRLQQAMGLSGIELAMLDMELGRYFGSCVSSFLAGASEQPDLIASHGHTIFHRPLEGITIQIGEPAQITELTGIPVVANFRSQDVALGGQGAPLVPIGDALLFGEYDACLNLGGIANCSFDRNGQRIAFDLAPCNMVLNALSGRAGLEFDEGGNMARSGNVLIDLQHELNGLDYYKRNPPKSLGREFFEDVFWPLLESSRASTVDLLATCTEHIAFQIAQGCLQSGRLLVTGGGAFNTYLVERIAHHTGADIVLPDEQIIGFKEALIFAFLGILRWRGEVNCLSSVTGARQDHCSGAIYLP